MHTAMIVSRHIGHPSGTAVDDHRLRIILLFIVGGGWIAVGRRSVAVGWIRIAVAIGIAAGQRCSSDEPEGRTGCYGTSPIEAAMAAEMRHSVSSPAAAEAAAAVSAERHAVSAPAAAEAAAVSTEATAEAATAVSAPAAALGLGRDCGE
jgi:hypothetical protein